MRSRRHHGCALNPSPAFTECLQNSKSPLDHDQRSPDAGRWDIDRWNDMNNRNGRPDQGNGKNSHVEIRNVGERLSVHAR